MGTFKKLLILAASLSILAVPVVQVATQAPAAAASEDCSGRPCHLPIYPGSVRLVYVFDRTGDAALGAALNNMANTWTAWWNALYPTYGVYSIPYGVYVNDSGNVGVNCTQKAANVWVVCKGFAGQSTACGTLSYSGTSGCTDLVWNPANGVIGGASSYILPDSQGPDNIRALHEGGHSVGLAHNTSTDSAMYPVAALASAQYDSADIVSEIQANGQMP